MKNLFITAILLLVGLGATMAQKRKPISPYHAVTVSSEKKVFSLGEPIHVIVNYYNGSDSIWKLYRPDSSFFVNIAYRHRLWKEQHLWRFYAFNKNVFINDSPNYPDRGFSSPVIGDNIVIQPKERYTFKTNIMDGYPPDEVLPGKLEIFASDDIEAIYSDTIEVCIKFTPESVNYMLERIADEKKRYGVLYVTRMILSDIYPDFKKYQFGHDDFGITYSEEQRKENEKLISAFIAYWEQNKETKVVKASIKKINTDLSKYDFMDMRRAKLQKNSCIKY